MLAGEIARLSYDAAIVAGTTSALHLAGPESRRIVGQMHLLNMKFEQVAAIEELALDTVIARLKGAACIALEGAKAVGVDADPDPATLALVAAVDLAEGA